MSTTQSYHVKCALPEHQTEGYPRNTCCCTVLACLAFTRPWAQSPAPQKTRPSSNAVLKSHGLTLGVGL